MFGILKSILGTKDDPKLAKALKKGAFLVDVRTTSEFSAGSVKGAVNIPLDQLQEQLMKFKGKRNIVVFCRSGNRSGQAKLLLEKKGYRNVINGGSWQNVKQAIKNYNNRFIKITYYHYEHLLTEPKSRTRSIFFFCTFVRFLCPKRNINE